MTEEIDKLNELLASGDAESVKLGLEICKDKYPDLWTTLVTTNSSSGVKLHSTNIEALKTMNIMLGSNVRYKGLEAPNMVVVGTNLSQYASLVGARTSIVLMCKYYCKSSQTFVQVQDRIECFQKV